MKKTSLPIRRSNRLPTLPQVRKSRMPWALAGLGAVALSGCLAYLSATAPRYAAAHSLPDPMMLVPGLLLLAVAFAMRAWPASVKAPASANIQPAVMNWARLSQLATRFFDERGLVSMAPSQPWMEGEDLTLRKSGRSYLVHASLWQSVRVDAPAVRLLAREVERRNGAGGILLCASDAFTPAAHQLARQHGVLLLDPSQLHAKPRADAPPVMAPSPSAQREPAPRPSEFARHVPAKVPVLRPDREVRVLRGFQPTEPLAKEEINPFCPTVPPMLTPREALMLDDYARPARRDFLPTEPMADADRAQLAQGAALANRIPTLRPDDALQLRRDFLPTEPLASRRVGAGQAIAA